MGSLNDAALDNLTNQNTDVNTASNLEQNEIEMLDVPEPPVVPGVNTDFQSSQTVESEQGTVSNDEFNTFNNAAMSAIPSQPTLDPIPTNFDIGNIGSVPPVDPNEKGNKQKNTHSEE